MEEALPRVIFDLESFQADSPSPLSESTLQGLQSLFGDDARVSSDSDRLFSEMADRNLPASSLVHALSASMDAPDPGVALFASRVYLSALLAPSAPLYTLFTPLAFLSLLGSLRRAFKRRQSGSLPAEVASHNQHGRKKRRRAGHREIHSSGDETGMIQTDNRLLFVVVEKLDLLLAKVHLTRFPESLKCLVDTVAEILVMGVEFYDNSANFSQFSSLCFQIMQDVLNPEHGDETVIATQVLKALSPAILLLKSRLRTLALRFVTHKMITMAKESDKIKKAMVLFPRYLINKSPEKSEHRASAVESVMEIVKAMEYSDQIEFASYVVKMTEGKAKIRMIAVDLIPMLLTAIPESLKQGANCWGSRCLEALVRHCSDVSAAIRARSLSNLANVIEFLSDLSMNSKLVCEVLGFADGKLNNLLRRRCKDEKAAVRKAALLLIIKSISLIGRVDEGMLKLIASACSDPLVSIRKAAVSALSEIFRKFSDNGVVTEWLHAVPRLITDNESTIQAESETLFQELVLDRVSRAGCSNAMNEASTSNKVTDQLLETELESIYTGGVITILKGICDGEVSPFVKKICSSLGKKNKLKPGIAISLQNIIRTSEAMWLRYCRPIEEWTAPSGAWLLLSEVSMFLPNAVGWKFLQHHWKLLDRNVLENDTRGPLIIEGTTQKSEAILSDSVAWATDRVFLLQTISNVAVQLPPEPAADLAQYLLGRIEGFDMHFTEINAHVKALRTLCKRKATITEKGDSLVQKCANQLLSKALSIVDSYITQIGQSSPSNLLTPLSGNKKSNQGKAGEKLLFQAVRAVFTIGSLVLICPSADLKGIIPLLQSIITSGSSAHKAKVLSGTAASIKQVAPSLYSQSWLTMGKICLVDGKFAKRYIPLFVQELEKSDDAAVRNNIVVVMADFCVRYTALVDCYIPKITNSLRDPCEVVRRQTFILLSRLLQQDYVKWRGILFLRFLLSLVDESCKIRQLADFLFGNILKAKAPLLAYNSFIEAVFVLNDCHAHAGQSEARNSQTGSYLFSISGNGEISRLQRMHIYVTLLKQMAPEHLLATSAKLCSEILASASDGLLDVHDITSQSVLQDALQILACKEIRIQSNRGLAAAETADIDEEGDNSGGAVAAAKGRLVTQAAKKNLIQNAVPIFIELKRLFESKNSPLIGCLMDCLRVLLKDYKNEIDDILVADPQLRKELLYDMQKYEAAKAKFTAQVAATSGQRSGGLPSTAASRLAGKSGAADSFASAVADVAAEATAKSVLKEVSTGHVSKTPMHSMSIPKLKSTGTSDRHRPMEVLESLRKRQSFDSEDEN